MGTHVRTPDGAYVASLAAAFADRIELGAGKKRAWRLRRMDYSRLTELGRHGCCEVSLPEKRS
jgi:hypothetical protein